MVVWVGIVQEDTESTDVTRFDGLTKSNKRSRDIVCCLVEDKDITGQTSQTHIRCYQVDEDRFTVFECISVALIVRCLECLNGAIEVVIGEMESTKVVEKCHPLSCRIIR